MAVGMRVRVTWDDTIVEDKLFVGRRVLRIGSGRRATTPAPHRDGWALDEERYATLTRKGRGFELRIGPGVAETVEFPGEEPIDLATLTSTFVRQLDPPYGSGRIRFAHATVEFERVGAPATARDRVLLAWSAAAMLLALLGGGSYRLVRQFGHGERPQWGKPPTLTASDADRVRVRIGPDGLGASRPQAGQGMALHGTRQSLRLAHDTASQRDKPKPKARPTAHARPVGAPRLLAQNGSGADVNLPPSPVNNPPPQAVQAKEPPRDKLVEDAQSALLQADLRKAIDSFSHAARSQPLDYDQLNWLGLAHYLSGEYDEATRVWSYARALDGGRADAVNNLASVQKRKNDRDAEERLLDEALRLKPEDCHASNSLALLQAKRADFAGALSTLERSDAACGGNYAYTAIQKAGILALRGDTSLAFAALEDGLKRVDTLIPIKEFEVLTDLTLDPAFARLRSDARFSALITKYLPRAAGWKDAPGLQAPSGESE